MIRRLKLRPFLYATGLFSVFVFQNCAQPPDLSQDQAQYNDSIPFAYKAQIDTLSYMSCSNLTANSYEPRAYYTFRAGAYNNTTGGLTITPAFYEATQYYANTDRANTLSSSMFNGNTILNFSIRASANYQQMYYVNQVAAQETVDQFLPELDGPQVAGPISSVVPGQMLNYFPGSDNTQRLMEASLRFMDYETNMAQIRNQISAGTLMLVAGYPETANVTDSSLKSPFDVDGTSSTQSYNASNATEVFGVGYKLGFSLPYGNTSGDARVLATYGSNSDIKEVDLTTNSIISSAWDCDSNFQFQVINPQDLVTTPGLCTLGADTYQTGNTTQQAALNAIRRVLRVEDWFVDVVHHCVVPRYGGDVCYGSSIANGEKIQYSLTACQDVPGTSVCPHFVSVCIRQ
jgi:hypothetical protein